MQQVAKQDYKQFKISLKNAIQGEVITRFAPEPSGYLHLGHVKAALITYHYAKMYDGKMILRFDDTNPTKEKSEFIDSIQYDLKSLGVEWFKTSYTSDYMAFFEQKAIELIKNGQAYCDNTPVEQMREERTAGIASPFRETSVEENLKIFKGMLNATQSSELAQKQKEYDEQIKQGKKPKAQDFTNYAAFCLRAKVSVDCLNKCMRDPVIYRCNFTPHHRTGTTYKAYPTYDFACPLIDAEEGITHAMRSKEYTDRVDQYNWFIKNCKVRPVNIFEFSRLNFVHIVLSKRKLQWFVETDKVEGWGDARMPTIRGILRRGMKVQTLTDFMLEIGASKKECLMEWDKIWSNNRKVIDPVCPRYTCIKSEKICKLTITNGPESVVYTTCELNPTKEAHPDFKALRPVARSKNVYIDFDDATNIKKGEKITLIKWGNITIDDVKQVGDALEFQGTYLPTDEDFKKTQKITWLSADVDLVEVNLIELDHLINVPKMEEGQDIEDVYNKVTKYETKCLADPLVRNVTVDSVLQFERRGYFRVDDVKLNKQGDKVVDVLFIPDGKTKSMTKNLNQKVDNVTLTGGSGGDKSKTDKKQAQKEKQRQQNQQQQQQQDTKKGGKKEKNDKQASSDLVITTTFGNFRSNPILVTAEKCFQKVETKYIQWQELKTKDNQHPMLQVPYLETKQGLIHQAGAQLRYIASRNKNSKVYGANDFEKAQIDQYIDFIAQDVQKVTNPLMKSQRVWGWTDYQTTEQEFQTIWKQLNHLNSDLQGKEYLVGKVISIADIFAHSYLVYIMRLVLTSEQRAQYSNLTAWFERVSKDKNVAKVYGINRYPSQAW